MCQHHGGRKNFQDETHTSEIGSDEDQSEDSSSQEHSLITQNACQDSEELLTDETQSSMSDLSTSEQTRRRNKKRKEFNLSHSYTYLVDHTLDGRLIKLFREDYMDKKGKKVLLGLLYELRKEGVFKRDEAGNWSIACTESAEKILEDWLERIKKHRASFKKKLPTKKKRSVNH